VYVHHTIIRRLFLLYAQSLRSIACFAGLFLRRQRRPSLYSFFYNDTIHLTDYRLVVYRRAEIGDITTVDSYYEGSGEARSEHSERLLSSIRRLFLPTVHSYGPPTVLLRSSYGDPLLIVRILHVREIYYTSYSSCLRDFIRLFELHALNGAIAYCFHKRKTI